MFANSVINGVNLGVKSLILNLFKSLFINLFLVISTLNMGLKLVTQKSTATCSSDWASQAAQLILNFCTDFAMPWFKEPLLLSLRSDHCTEWIVLSSEVRKLMPRDRQTHLTVRPPCMWGSEHLTRGTACHEWNADALAHS